MNWQNILMIILAGVGLQACSSSAQLATSGTDDVYFTGTRSVSSDNGTAYTGAQATADGNYYNGQGVQGNGTQPNGGLDYYNGQGNNSQTAPSTQTQPANEVPDYYKPGASTEYNPQSYNSYQSNNYSDNYAGSTPTVSGGSTYITNNYYDDYNRNYIGFAPTIGFAYNPFSPWAFRPGISIGFGYGFRSGWNVGVGYGFGGGWGNPYATHYGGFYDPFWGGGTWGSPWGYGYGNGWGFGPNCYSPYGWGGGWNNGWGWNNPWAYNGGYYNNHHNNNNNGSDNTPSRGRASSAPRPSGGVSGSGGPGRGSIDNSGNAVPPPGGRPGTGRGGVRDVQGNPDRVITPAQVSDLNNPNIPSTDRPNVGGIRQNPGGNPNSNNPNDRVPDRYQPSNRQPDYNRGNVTTPSRPNINVAEPNYPSTPAVPPVNDRPNGGIRQNNTPVKDAGNQVPDRYRPASDYYRNSGNAPSAPSTNPRTPAAPNTPNAPTPNGPSRGTSQSNNPVPSNGGQYTNREVNGGMDYYSPPRRNAEPVREINRDLAVPRTNQERVSPARQMWRDMAPEGSRTPEPSSPVYSSPSRGSSFGGSAPSAPSSPAPSGGGGNNGGGRSGGGGGNRRGW